jgi:hypothetical protein
MKPRKIAIGGAQPQHDRIEAEARETAEAENA